MADLLPTDVLLVNRAGVDYRVAKSAVMATVQDTDLLLVNRAGVDYQATFADVKKGFGPGVISPKPGDTTATPGFVSGTGTQADPFIITPATVGGAGGQTQSAQAITFSGLTTGSIVEWTDKSTGAGTRFKQPVDVVSGTTWTGHLVYSDQPPSAAAGTYTGDLQIGTTYFRWVVTQQLGETPDLTAVTLSDVAGGGRFTSQAFPILAELDKDGKPVSTKKLKAWVQGALKVSPQTSAITAVKPVTSGTLFNTTLATGTGGVKSVATGIDLTGGGMVWSKIRSEAGSHFLFDTVRGPLNAIRSNGTGGSNAEANSLTAFTATGFDVGSDSTSAINGSGKNYAYWTFRKAAKFFDVVTYTGTGTTNNISHNLGSTPGCVIIKRTNTTGNWAVYHRSRGTSEVGFLNTTDAFQASGTNYVTGVSSTTFTVQSTAGDVNANGSTYVAYLFAHDTDPSGLIQCGSYTGNGSTTGPTVTLGWEPQWLLVKVASGGTGDWALVDTARGWTASANNCFDANSSDAESVGANNFSHLSTGFRATTRDPEYNGSGLSYIYIAIRGPAVGQATELTFTDATDLVKFAASDAITEITAANATGDATGSVSSVDAANNKMTVSHSTAWDVGSKVKGPKKVLQQCFSGQLLNGNTKVGPVYSTGFSAPGGININAAFSNSTTLTSTNGDILTWTVNPAWRLTGSFSFYVRPTMRYNINNAGWQTHTTGRITVPGDASAITSIAVQDPGGGTGGTIFGFPQLNGVAMIDAQSITTLTFAPGVDLTALAPGNTLTQGAATGTVGSIAGQVVTMATSTGTWSAGTVAGPCKPANNVKLYCTLNTSGTVTDLQSNDPGYQTWPATVTANPKVYSGTLTFPATLPTGQPPDTEMPAGTSLEVEVEASNTSGSDTQKSNTIIPT